MKLKLKVRYYHRFYRYYNYHLIEMMATTTYIIVLNGEMFESFTLMYWSSIYLIGINKKEKKNTSTHTHIRFMLLFECFVNNITFPI